MSIKQPFGLMCPICLEDFDTEACAPFVGMCGHSLCSTCVDKIGTTCPSCMNCRGFSSKVKNYALIEVIMGFADVMKRVCAEPDQKCTQCKKEVPDEEAFTCISCSTCADADSVDDFLTKASRNRFCDGCGFPKEPHVSRRWRDVKMSVKSKEFAETEKSGNYKAALSELDSTLCAAQKSISLIEEHFPFGKKISGDCSDQQMEELKATAKICLEKAARTVRKGITAMNTMAERLAKVSNSLSRLPHVVALDPKDNEFLDKIIFSERKSSVFDEDMMQERRSRLSETSGDATGSIVGFERDLSMYSLRTPYGHSVESEVEVW